MSGPEADDILTVEQADEIAAKLTDCALRIERCDGGVRLCGPKNPNGTLLKPSQMTRLGIVEVIADRLSW